MPRSARRRTAMPGLLGSGRARGIAAVTALAIVQGCAAAAAAFATRMLFDSLHNGETPPTAVFAALVLSGLAIAATRVAFRTTGERIGQSYAHDIRAALFLHSSSMSARAVDLRRTGYMSLRFVGDMAAFKNRLALGLPRLVSASILLAFCATVFFVFDPVFGALAAGTYVLCVLIFVLGERRLVTRHQRLRASRAELAADMTERMPIAPELGWLGRKGTETRLIRKRSDRLVSAAVERIRTAEILHALPDAAAGLAAAAVIGFGAQRGLSTGTIAAGLATLGLSVGALRELSTVADIEAEFSAAHAKCWAALERPVRAARKRRAPLPAGALGFSVNDLRIGPVTGLSCKIPPGARAFVDGAVGTGKSLLLAAIAGRADPESGRIRIAGVTLERIDDRELGRRVALIGTAPVILRGSLRRNLTLGVSKRPADEEIVSEAEKWGLGPLLARVGGLDGTLAEGGRDLSSGERVLIAIIRASLEQPDIWLFDRIGHIVGEEATAAIDAELRRISATSLTARTTADRELRIRCDPQATMLA